MLTRKAFQVIKPNTLNLPSNKSTYSTKRHEDKERTTTKPQKDKHLPKAQDIAVQVNLQSSNPNQLQKNQGIEFTLQLIAQEKEQLKIQQKQYAVQYFNQLMLRKALGQGFRCLQKYQQQQANVEKGSLVLFRLLRASVLRKYKKSFAKLQRLVQDTALEQRSKYFCQWKAHFLQVKALRKVLVLVKTRILRCTINKWMLHSTLIREHAISRTKSQRQVVQRLNRNTQRQLHMAWIHLVHYYRHSQILSQQKQVFDRRTDLLSFKKTRIQNHLLNALELQKNKYLISRVFVSWKSMRATHEKKIATFKSSRRQLVDGIHGEMIQRAFLHELRVLWMKRELQTLRNRVMLMHLVSTSRPKTRLSKAFNVWVENISQTKFEEARGHILVIWLLLFWVVGVAVALQMRWIDWELQM